MKLSQPSFRGILAASQRNIAAGCSGLTLGSILGLGLILWSNRSSPVIVNTAYEVEDANRAGQINILFDIDRTRDCPSETSRWLWTWVEKGGTRIKQYFPLPSSPTTITGIGYDQRFILSLPVPSGVWAGDWYYWSKTVENCSFLPSFFRAQIIETPEIPIRITDAP